jgi:hypothetical protein
MLLLVEKTDLHSFVAKVPTLSALREPKVLRRNSNRSVDSIVLQESTQQHYYNDGSRLISTVPERILFTF